jgi:hypothetical protein
MTAAGTAWTAWRFSATGPSRLKGRTFVTEASLNGRLKAAAPAIGAGALVASILAVSLATGIEKEGERAQTAAVQPIPAAAGSPQPGGLPGVAFDQGVPGAPNVQMGVEIVVKFKDDAKVKDIIDAFWKDQADARKRFETFRSRNPAFAGLKLDRVTYSNELVLTGSGAEAPAALRALANKLGALPEISYAEPNATAHPGGQ